MDSLIVAFWGFTQYTAGTIFDLFKTLDIGVILAINVLTSVLKSALSRTKETWLTDQTILVWIAALSLAAGWIWPPVGTVFDERLKGALYYMGCSCVFFMIWKHLIVALFEKLFGGSAMVMAMKNVFVTAAQKKDPPTP
jgi:hypothetical protein